MLERGATVTIWPRRGLGLGLLERAVVVLEDDLGVVVRYRYDGGERQTAAIHWSAISRVEIHDDLGVAAA